MALKGKIYSLAKQREDIDSRNIFESMIKRSADQNSIFMDGRNLAAGSIFADQISAGAITTGKIKADAVTTDKIIAGAITTTHLAANSVTAQKISVDELSAITSDIGEITAGLIKSSDDSSYFNMTQGKFSFANDKIFYDGKDLSISADSIDLEGKVTFSSFSNSLQTAWSDSVRDSSDAKTKTDEWSWGNTTEIDGGAIRTQTITADQIKANSITSTEIKAGSITSEEINVNELSSIASNIGTVNAGLIKSFDESIIINLDEGLITLGKPLKIQGKTVATEDDISSLGYGDIISKSGQKIFTDQAEDSAVHVEVDGQSYQENDEPTPDNPSEIYSLNDFDVVSSVEKLSEGQLQEYDYGVEYENVNFINLTLPESLRSVGNVKDRIYKDSDGLWKVERNVGKVELKGTERWRSDSYRDEGYNYAYFRPINFKDHGEVRSNILPQGNISDDTRETVGKSSVIAFNLSDSRTGVLSSDSGSQRANKIRDYLFSIEGAMVSYELATPTIETLDQELQDQLNTLKSFKGSNYIYTVNNTEDLPDQIKENLIPTLHATFKGSGWLPKYNAEQARIDLKSETNDIRNDIDNLVTLDQYNLNKGETDQILNDYQVAIDVARRELNGLVNEDGELILGEDGKPLQKGVVNEVMDLLGRTALVESDYGEHSKKLKFMQTDVVMGAEGLFIGDTETKTGIMISPRVEETTENEARASRIDFLDNNEVVAYISSYMMEITRGIFVESAQIGEHKIETIGDGHTTFQWIPK